MATNKPIVLFHGIDPKKYPEGKNYSVLSNWYPCVFTDGSGHVTYLSSEQFMMNMKAILFGDFESSDKIMAIGTREEVENYNPITDQQKWFNKMKKIKAFGRKVANFDEKTWENNRRKIVKQALLLKFEQNKYCLDILLGTDEALIAEAAPNDHVWGIGLSANHPDAKDPKKWKGKNLLGELLQEVRSELGDPFRGCEMDAEGYYIIKAIEPVKNDLLKFSCSLSSNIRFGKFPTQEEANLLIKYNYSVFVDLTEDSEITWERYELPKTTKFYKYPIKDRTPGSKDDFDKFMMDLINFIKSGDKIYIHCRGGHGRSSMVAGILFGKITSTPPDQVLKLVYDTHQTRTEMDHKWRKMGAPQTKSQKAYLKKLL